MDNEKIAKEIYNLTDGFVKPNKTAISVSGGVYEIHLKPFHLPFNKGINLFGIKELQEEVYKWATTERILDMVRLGEYPLNIRTIYIYEGDRYLLQDTEMLLNELPSVEDLEAIVKIDEKEIKKVLMGEVD